MDQTHFSAMWVKPEEGPRVHREICDQLADFWGQRDVGALHHPMWLRQFVANAVVVRHDDLLVGYLFGALASPEVAYIHLVATRLAYQNRGIARNLYATFLADAARRGARTAEAITTPNNADSITFHKRLGFHTETISNYVGPGNDRVLFRRDLAGVPVEP